MIVSLYVVMIVSIFVVMIMSIFVVMIVSLYMFMIVFLFVVMIMFLCMSMIMSLFVVMIMPLFVMVMLPVLLVSLLKHRPYAMIVTVTAVSMTGVYIYVPIMGAMVVPAVVPTMAMVVSDVIFHDGHYGEAHGDGEGAQQSGHSKQKIISMEKLNFKNCATLDLADLVQPGPGSLSPCKFLYLEILYQTKKLPKNVFCSILIRPKKQV